MSTTTVEAATDLVLRSDQKFFDGKQVAALRAMGVAPDTSNADLAVFFHQARRTGLDPFAKQIYLMQRRSKNQRSGEWETKSTIQTGIDGYRLIARKAATKQNTDYDYGPVEWCDEEGNWTDVWLHPGQAPIAARVTLYVGEKNKQYPAIAHYSEYVQVTKDGAPNSMWTKMAASQLAKCAEALALRKAFPLDLSGIYTDDEMQQADEALADLGETSGEPVTADNAPKTPVQRKRRSAAKAPEPTTPEPAAHAPAPEPEDLGEKEPEPDPVDPDAAERTDPAAPDPADPAEPPADYGDDEAEPEDQGPAAVLEADTEPEAASTPAEAPAAAPAKAAQFRKMVELSKEAYPDEAELRMFLSEWFRSFRGLDKLVALPGPNDTSREEAEALIKHVEALLAGELPGV
jgi:phage recombination protein Bet